MKTLKVDLLALPKLVFAVYAVWVTRHDPVFFVLMFLLLKNFKIEFEFNFK